jgi:hypothetical protein
MDANNMDTSQREKQKIPFFLHILCRAYNVVCTGYHFGIHDCTHQAQVVQVQHEVPDNMGP